MKSNALRNPHYGHTQLDTTETLESATGEGQKSAFFTAAQAQGSVFESIFDLVFSADFIKPVFSS